MGRREIREEERRTGMVRERSKQARRERGGRIEEPLRKESRARNEPAR